MDAYRLVVWVMRPCHAFPSDPRRDPLDDGQTARTRPAEERVERGHAGADNGGAGFGASEEGGGAGFVR
ncbi:hypothetical protein BO82DRAFT_351429 [Aspergillus uvarum CBS 121591]|uniref:Uncharacterized protein n=1 Tax=Aspergillus uvarum CBS 121591 TaxID=1448315 RepID=A0A319CKK3_9EURO|nr:hypothetical protein BO82DRAFT_351429 [Aspergillus uvarum CBS 121591]PYH85070.1 hypothetical protein BO82DRAFT_351429 [Aspergillus uvarum CBS 121591]